MTETTKPSVEETGIANLGDVPVSAEEVAAAGDPDDSADKPQDQATVPDLAAQRAAAEAERATWRDVDDNPWQADEEAPPPVIG